MKGLRQSGQSATVPAPPACAVHRRARRHALVAFAVAAAAMAAWAQAALTPAAAAVGSAATGGPPATCVIHSLPAFVAQGENIDGRNTAATVADVVDIECDPTVYGTKSRMKLLASQLYSRCAGNLTWYVPNNPPGEGIPGGYEVIGGRGVTVNLDADGGATVALRAGPDCAAGESLIVAHMEEAPFESFTTSFVVLPPQTTPPGVYALPSTQVEDSYSSAVATVIEAEFENGSEKLVRIASEELYRRCRVAPHIHWILMNGEEAPPGPEVTGVRLDNDGNAFVIAIGDASCAPGTSLIEADLESKPFTTFTTNFTIYPPQPTAEPAFSIEKLQEIGGGGKGFTASPLTGALGQTVHYQITVKNTGRVDETFSDFTDPHCDAGTIAGGPGASPVASEGSTTFTCSHVLTSPGTYFNEASLSGRPQGQAPITHTSNQVEVIVAPQAGPSATPGGGGAQGVPTSGVKPAEQPCVLPQPVWRGASGARRSTFSLQLSSIGIKRVTFYLDGR